MCIRKNRREKNEKDTNLCLDGMDFEVFHYIQKAVIDIWLVSNL